MTGQIIAILKNVSPLTQLWIASFLNMTTWSKLVLKLFYNYILKQKHAVALKTMFRNPKKLFPIESLSDFRYYYEILSLRTPNFES